MCKNIFYCIVAVFSFSVHSQTFQWLNTSPITFSSNSDNISYTVTSDSFGNVYMMGYKNTPFPYGEILGTQFYNKYDAGGTLLFSNEITGNATIFNAVTDSNDNILIIIGYVGTINIGTLTLESTHQGFNYSLVKFDSLGTAIWSRQFTLNDGTVNHARSVAVDNLDNIYVGYDNYNNSYIEKITPTGAVVFTIIQNQVQIISSISVDNEGNIYAAGSCAKPNAMFANTSIAPPAGFEYNVYVAKYSPLAAFQWVKYVEDITCSDAQVKVRNSDAIYFTSQLYGAYSFDALTAQGPTAGFTDVFIAKLNSSGGFEWIREVSGAGSLGNGKRNTFEVDAINNVYFGGKTSGTVNWGNNLVTSTGTNSGNLDAIVLKYNSEGEIMMAKLAGGMSADRVDGLNISDDGSINICGTVKGSGNFDAITFTGATNQTTPYLAKLSNENLNAVNFDSSELLLYPNPSKDAVFISNSNHSVEGIIFTTLGQEVKSFILNPLQPLSISDLADGTYFIKVQGMKTAKFIKF